MIDTLLANRYRIQEKVGEGGMAVVYRALDVVLRRVVAIKVLRPQYAGDQEFVDRFRREAQAAASLSHPNVVNIFDVGQEDDVHFIVLEYVQGKNLKELVREHGRLSPRRSVQVARAVARALEAAHQRGLIHRDIKPHNILITPEGRVKVADFGLARATSAATLTETGVVIGSVHYFSPEQARGDVVGPASDIYSLGVVLYEMLTGTVPFRGDSPISVALKHLQDEPPSPREHDPRIPEWLDQVVMRALAKDPHERFPSAAAMAEALEWRMERPHLSAAAGRPRPLAAPLREDSAPRQVVKVHDDAEGREDELEKTRVVSSNGLGRRLAETDDLPSPPDLHERLRRELEREGDAGNGAGHGVPASDELGSGETAAAADESEEQRPRRRRPWLTAFIVFMLLAAAAYFSRPYVVALVFPPEVAVPNVVGLTYDEARPIMVEAGLSLEIEAEQFHPDMAPGLIVRQNPSADRIVRQGRQVRVVLSRGPETGVVPDVVGMPLRDARIAVTQAGYTLGEELDDFTDEFAVNHVSAQQPPPGAEAEKGTPINLWVSRTAATVNELIVVPDFRGRPLDEAVAELEKLGLLVGNRWPELRPLVPAGLVLDQNPEPDTVVEPGTAINFVYSQGLPGQSVPGERSSGPSSAGAVPEPRGPIVEPTPMIEEEPEQEVDWGTVLSDEAEARRRRARIDVEVPPGREQEVVILIIDDFGAREVFRQTVPGGTTVHEFVEGRGDQARLQVYVGGVMYMDQSFPD